MIRNYEHEQYEKYHIEITSIDEHFENCDTPVKFMKIDVENFEYFVLTGAVRIIRRFKPAIYLEISGKQKASVDEITEFLKEQGYLIYVEDASDYILYNPLDADLKVMDLFAIHPKLP